MPDDSLQKLVEQYRRPCLRLQTQAGLFRLPRLYTFTAAPSPSLLVPANPRRYWLGVVSSMASSFFVGPGPGFVSGPGVTGAQLGAGAYQLGGAGKWSYPIDGGMVQQEWWGSTGSPAPFDAQVWELEYWG